VEEEISVVVTVVEKELLVAVAGENGVKMVSGVVGGGGGHTGSRNVADWTKIIPSYVDFWLVRERGRGRVEVEDDMKWGKREGREGGGRKEGRGSKEEKEQKEWEFRITGMQRLKTNIKG
jgi:hypothetical protein